MLCFSCGVPQGSILGTTLFNLYTPLNQTEANNYYIFFHQCARNTQLYMPLAFNPQRSI